MRLQVDLYESELDDNGVARMSIKARARNHVLFLHSRVSKQRSQLLVVHRPCCTQPTSQSNPPLLACAQQATGCERC